ncbi:Hypothetical Protein SLY_0943 [Strawberry lethal yellows phytoplasma (CPA) str. NZSb11]|uniref:Uncharacterized protein n=1 Tax=Strawberry lethal yellows phytoplasma (CPA) str. NZSb11 TaxID=980422 RepID=R4RN37_PHYAS|nr:Hypothetical Protein SLY_0252 [Strawberry lethal yellows phytoplasma (CPA) str. NZSb11]AGL90770.1 Hypothetical Protein SLY_0855 [Strawberry lethal yellows phytoplasma (CPA) str. NZSb11]AGL90858.1 Hypothetical Protein SLY_0943 [Strawberry lethal yellows phytoplasma (CPA) str. NZSb11]
MKQKNIILYLSKTRNLTCNYQQILNDLEQKLFL